MFTLQSAGKEGTRSVVTKANSRGYIKECSIWPSLPVCREVEQDGSHLAQLSPAWCVGSVAATLVSPYRSLPCPSRFVIPDVLPDPRWLRVVAKPFLAFLSAPGTQDSQRPWSKAPKCLGFFTSQQVGNLGVALPKSTETEFRPRELYGFVCLARAQICWLCWDSTSVSTLAVWLVCNMD